MNQTQASFEKSTLIPGFNKTVKLMLSHQAQQVFLASDADVHIASQIRAMCRTREIPLDETHNKKALGRLCAIEVGCAVATVKKAEA